jgi:hypothetical protein
MWLLLLPAAAAAAGHSPHQIVRYFDGAHTVVEAENFTTASTGCRRGPAPGGAGGWSPCVWGADDNLFASDVSNVVMSRAAYLHADANATAGAPAVATVPVAADGAYTVLIRYEAGYRFSSPFKVTVAQHGRTAFEKVYGLRTTPKVWAFWNSRGPPGSDANQGCGPGLQPECRWIYSSSENMVWEGVGNVANLTAGDVTLTITAVGAAGSAAADPSVQGDRWGAETAAGLVTERNIDVVVLNPNATDLELRMNATCGAPCGGSDVQGLIFDSFVGTQEGEVFARVTSESELAFNLPFPRTINRSPLWFGRSYFPTWANVDGPGTPWTLYDGCGAQHPKTVVYAPNASAAAPPPPAGPIGSQCVYVRVGPREVSAWVDVGRMLDTLDHSSWNLPLGNYSLQLAVKDGATGALVPLPAVYKGNPTHRPLAAAAGLPLPGPVTSILIDPSTRATRRTRDIADDFMALYANLSASPAPHGHPATRVMVAAGTFPRGYPRGIGSSGTGVLDPRWDAAVRDFEKMNGLTGNDPWPRNCTTDAQRAANCTTDFASMDGREVLMASWVSGALDLHNASIVGGLAAMAAGNAGASASGLPADKTHFSLNLGDEIGLGGPETRYGPPATNQTALNHAFEAWLESKQIAPAAAGCAPYVGCVYNTTLPWEGERANFAGFYHSKRFSNDFGIANATYNPVTPSYKNLTDTLKAFQAQTGRLTNGLTCANFPPSAGYMDTQRNLSRLKSYMPDVFMWVRSYREGTFMLPMTEDYIFQIAAGTQQVFDLVIDVERAGVRPNASARALAGELSPGDVRVAALKALPATAAVPGRPILQYVMTHDPGQTPNNHRRRFYGGLAHGNKWTNLFEFQTFATGAGDFCDGYGGDGKHNGMYANIRAQISELGTFDDILAAGVPNAFGAKAALLFSETADIYFDDYGTPGSEKEALYIALRHGQIALDVVIEDDVVDGTLNEYAALYLTAAHVTTDCGEQLVRWVERGGSLFATSGLGLLNETNQTSPALAALLGVTSHAVYGRGVGPGTEEISYIKQDLAFATVLDRVSVAPGLDLGAEAPAAAGLAVVGEKAILALDAAPAAVLATFADHSPAVYRPESASGLQGSVVVAAFPVGLSYFHPAMPKRPPARGNTDLTYNHWIPTAFDGTARALLGLAVANVVGARPVLSSEPRVDIGVIAAAGVGTAVVVTNWTPEPLRALNLTLQFECAFTHASLASGGAVAATTTAAGWKTFELDLAVADCLVLR